MALQQSLVICLYVLLLAEGILRKWLVPSAGQPLTVVRDPIMAILILLHLLHNRLSWLTFLWVALTWLLTSLMLVQAINGSLPLIIGVWGLRCQVLFIPLMMVIPEVGTDLFLRKLFVLNGWLSVPIALLTTVQHWSTSSSFINRAVDEDARIFTISDGVVRPAGVFTFTLGHVLYALFTLACLFVLISRRRRWGLSKPTLIIFGASALVCGILSGARSYYAAALLVVSSVVCSTLFGPDIKRGLARFTAYLIVSITSLALVLVTFPEMITLMSSRQLEASRSEGRIWSRAFSFLAQSVNAIWETTPLGKGLGIGTNAGSYLLTGAREFTLAEEEWPRVIFELGYFFGPLLIVLRLTLLSYVALRCVRSVRQTGDPGSAAFVGLLLPLFLTGQISSFNPAVTFVWLASGLALLVAATSGDRREPRLLFFRARKKETVI